jgi:hypothetical protein
MPKPHSVKRRERKAGVWARGRIHAGKLSCPLESFLRICFFRKGGGYMDDSRPSFSTGCERLGVCEFSPTPDGTGGRWPEPGSSY